MRPIGLSIMIGLVALACGSAAHALECGDRIEPGQKIVLDRDVGPCSWPNWITIVGPATLDLNGHQITCDGVGGSGLGIELSGKKAKLTNGSVFACGTAVLLAGEGSHKVTGVLAGSSRNGFLVYSDRNKLIDNDGMFTNDAFRIEGQRTLLKKNFASDSQNGFVVEASALRTRLIRNEARENQDRGIWLHANPSELTKHVVARNISLDTNGYDVVDTTTPCGLNRWKNNLYESAVGPCFG